jgi:hypothetical protein
MFFFLLLIFGKVISYSTCDSPGLDETIESDCEPDGELDCKSDSKSDCCLNISVMNSMPEESNIEAEARQWLDPLNEEEDQPEEEAIDPII